MDQSFLDREIDAALAPYRDLVSPEELAFMRAELLASVTDGAAAVIARRAAPRVVDESGAMAYSADEAATVPIAVPAGVAKRGAGRSGE